MPTRRWLLHIVLGILVPYRFLKNSFNQNLFSKFRQRQGGTSMNRTSPCPPDPSSSPRLLPNSWQTTPPELFINNRPIFYAFKQLVLSHSSGYPSSYVDHYWPGKKNLKSKSFLCHHIHISI